jgi:DNA polymerase I-like protein with 3'-5' exonuclease and polymerase domains
MNILKVKERKMKPIVPPAIRRLFKPDKGYILFECDLKRADAQIVAKESNDTQLIEDFRNNVDIYTENASWSYKLPPEKITTHQYQMHKAGVHATNYGAKARTIAHTIEVTETGAQDFLFNWWFKKHPGIFEWHKDVNKRVIKTGTIHNVYGFRKVYTGRRGEVLPQALAWIASSTVSVTTNKAMLRVYNELPSVHILLQIHDSFIGQVLAQDEDRRLREVMSKTVVEIPYKGEPLVIPFSMKTSSESWGDVKPWHG